MPCTLCSPPISPSKWNIHNQPLKLFLDAWPNPVGSADCSDGGPLALPTFRLGNLPSLLVCYLYTIPVGGGKTVWMVTSAI